MIDLLIHLYFSIIYGPYLNYIGTNKKNIEKNENLNIILISILACAIIILLYDINNKNNNNIIIYSIIFIHIYLIYIFITNRNNIDNISNNLFQILDYYGIIVSIVYLYKLLIKLY